MTLQIPKSERSFAVQFAAAPKTLIDAVYRCLADVDVVTVSANLESCITASIKGKEPDALPYVKPILRILNPLYYLKQTQNMDASTIAGEFISALQEPGFHAEIEEPKHGWSELQSQLEQLLSLDKTLGVAAKALFLLAESPASLESVRVLTDARPIFDSELGPTPAAFVITHTLQLRANEDAESKQYFFSLDRDDLQALKQAVDRAVAKDESLKNTLALTKVPVLHTLGKSDET